MDSPVLGRAQMMFFIKIFQKNNYFANSNIEGVPNLVDKSSCFGWTSAQYLPS